MSLAVARGSALTLARRAVLFGLVLLFLSKGSHPPLAWINDLVYRIPGMFLFLEPAAQIGALFALSLACGIGYEALNRRFQKNSRLVFAIVSCVAIGLECWPLFSGSMFREPSPTWASLPSAYVKVPDDWLALESEMLNRASSDSILLLPPNKDYQSEYTWGYHGVDLGRNGHASPIGTHAWLLSQLYAG